jgi:splicing factor 3B subunit 3
MFSYDSAFLLIAPSVLFQDCLSPLSMQALPASPESLCIVEMGGAAEGQEEVHTTAGLFLNIGLQVGLVKMI